MTGTVLIIDDFYLMRDSLEFIVGYAGHKVVGSPKDSREALELYRELKPDLVILDSKARGMDGLTPMEAINKEDPGAKVILVTPLGHTEKPEETQSPCAKGYIRKPFLRKDIAKEIERVLATA